MANENVSSSSSKVTSSISQKDLLQFYQKKYEEALREEDRYKERVDKHLKELITDRHELETEVLRRGEKIADLQKALVELQLSVFEERERFLRVSVENEELKKTVDQLHENIHQLLAVTREQDLRDKILYILKDPKVEIGFQADSSKSKSPTAVSSSQKMGEEIGRLKHQLDEVLEISKSKANIVLGDCKQALEKSKSKILEDEIKIRELQKELSDLKREEREIAPAVCAKNSLKDNPPAKSTFSDSEVFSKICSYFKDMHILLIMLIKVISRINKILNAVQTTKLYQRMAKIPKIPSDAQYDVGEEVTDELEKCLRKCTRLTFDINNLFKSLCKYVGNNKNKIQNLTLLKSELKHLEGMLEELAVTTADNDLLNVSLKRSGFYNTLRDSSIFISNLDRLQHLGDFKKIVTNCESLSKIVSKAADFVESAFEKYHVKRDLYDIADSLRDFSSLSAESQIGTSRSRTATRSDSDAIPVTQEKSPSVEDLEKLLGIYKRTVQEAENLGIGHSSELKLLAKKVKSTEERLQEEGRSKESSSNFNDDVRETFAKSNIPKSAQATLPKSTLETMPTQVTLPKSAQATLPKSTQATAPESTQATMTKPTGTGQDAGQQTSRQTVAKSSSSHEDVLRSIDKTLLKVKSIEEGKCFKDEEMCRSLAENIDALTRQFKQLTREFNVKSVQDQFSEYSKVTLSKLEELAKQSRNVVIAAEAQIAAHRSNAKQLSEKLKDTEQLLRESINECLSLKQKLKQVESKHELERYTMISSLKDKIGSSRGVDEAIDELVSEFPIYEGGPFVCVYCRKGPGHKFCEEKIKDLTAECRKYKTELKLFKQEANEEKSTLKFCQEAAEQKAAETAKGYQEMKEALTILEKKNVSLVEQLKLERKRLKNMERFRRLEMEGFQTDVNQLKAKIKSLEKQLMKAVLIFENESKDLELLKSVHETAQRSQQATQALRRLKAKLYQLESDIKNL